MSQFKANENYERHVKNMDYTAIQNTKAKAIDNDDWDELSRLQKIEDELVKGL
ncbi:hypothetical protein N7931_17725 [Catenovulum sp. 2E275]|uniref:hypothetical protein n=1 Tax=Catenovulum sp. 2E275 TaxID=2980497 RepID=UPI0021D38E82|nr:hypothetical protein [Catenovulum sp. 2E275]MCU4677465.1 hypothetical protein [Catenovulum sp. 2E275]